MVIERFITYVFNAAKIKLFGTGRRSKPGPVLVMDGTLDSFAKQNANFWRPWYGPRAGVDAAEDSATRRAHQKMFAGHRPISPTTLLPTTPTTQS